MSGHNKWSSIKHKKGAADAKRGKIFTKIIKEITVAAKNGGGDPDSNARLRTAIINAKAANMPNDNITRAIKKGTGEIEGSSYEEMSYEGYSAGGAAIFIEVMTDNKNRTLGEIRSIFTKLNANIGATGCVAWMFDQKGVVTVSKENMTEDQIMEYSLEAGADDVEEDGDSFLIYTDKTILNEVRDALEAKGLKVENAEITMIPKTTTKITGKDAENTVKLIERLEENDDVQKVHSNFEIDDEEMDKIVGGEN
jgi:YebC/PmpR family DNA-binding regulatory protein